MTCNVFGGTIDLTQLQLWWIYQAAVETRDLTEVSYGAFLILRSFLRRWLYFVVNSGDYVQAVCDRNLAENITRVLYPNDNVCHQ